MTASAARATDAPPTVGELVAGHCQHSEPLVDRYVQALLDAQPGGRPHVLAIVLYGSCLSAQMRKTGAFFDFFVVVDSYRDYFARAGHALVGPVLPPSVFYTVFPEAGRGAATGDSTLRCKYNVISREQFIAETGPGAGDIHTLGRFSKRVGLVYARDPAARRLLMDRIESAMGTVLDHALTRVGDRFTLEELLLAQMGISYEGEHRVKEAAKVRALLEAERPYYEATYGRLLDDRVGDGQLTPLGERTFGPPPGWDRSAAQQRTDRFLQRSRMRGVFRWPKYIFTVDNWVEIILDKLERHNGLKLELTPLQRRYPLVFGWRHIYRVFREGFIR